MSYIGNITLPNPVTVNISVEEYERLKRVDEENKKLRNEVDTSVNNVENKVVTYTTEVNLDILKNLTDDEINTILYSKAETFRYATWEFRKGYQQDNINRIYQKYKDIIKVLRENSYDVMCIMDGIAKAYPKTKKRNITIDTLDTVKEDLYQKMVETEHKELKETVCNLEATIQELEQKPLDRENRLEENIKVLKQSHLKGVLEYNNKLKEKEKYFETSKAENNILKEELKIAKADVNVERRNAEEYYNSLWKYKKEHRHIIQYKEKILDLINGGYNFFNATKKLKQIKKIFNLEE